MKEIILIRHAPTEPVDSVAATDWQLTEEAQYLCEKLAIQLKQYDIQHIYTSTEHKAQQTGQYVADVFNLAYSTVDNLHETERKSKNFYQNEDEFKANVKAAMQSPDELLFGDETFTAACERFSKQVALLAKNHPAETIAIVSHGRVLSMYLGNVMSKEPEIIWEALGMPAYAVLAWESKIIKTVVNTIE